MQFSTVASFVVVSGAVALAQTTTAAAVSQIGDGQIQATSATSVATSAASSTGNATIITQTANGAANYGSGAAAMAGLVAAGAMLI
ncbi:LAME_0H05908g1_1 [Lachancea meyersii CBS 8951]|uniref:LAME_0H05908g1_1 n=1 Tax=Lachancea meyersii CBS 8951 TaxID=1266667 RepID=A0A1G4KEC3_9SACH|nr:LAME_0H05908g1_1 [Lachancea meyersii CBS 8951]